MKGCISLFVLVMLFPACSRTPAPGNGDDGGAALAGTLSSWSGGAATIAAESFGETGEPLGTVASAELAADGSFRLELPDEVPADLLVSTNASVICPQGGVTVTPSSFESVILFDLTVLQGAAVEGFAVLASSAAFANEESATLEDFIAFYVYSDRTVSIQGTCVYPEGFSEEIDANLEAGWNTLVYRVVAVGAGFPTRFETTDAPVPSGAEWYFVPTIPAL